MTQVFAATPSYFAHNSGYTNHHLKQIAQIESPHEIDKVCLYNHPKPSSIA
jgi:hypothetical protein